MEPTKPSTRQRSSINPDTIERGFSLSLPDDMDAGVSSTTLSRVSRDWRKLLSSLRNPIGSPERTEGELILTDLEIRYENGPFNSRIFFDNKQWLD